MGRQKRGIVGQKQGTGKRNTVLGAQGRNPFASFVEQFGSLVPLDCEIIENISKTFPFRSIFANLFHYLLTRLAYV